MAGVQFEVHPYNGGKGAIAEVVPTEESARAKADALLSLKNCLQAAVSATVARPAASPASGAAAAKAGASPWQQEAG